MSLRDLGVHASILQILERESLFQRLDTLSSTLSLVRALSFTEHRAAGLLVPASQTVSLDKAVAELLRAQRLLQTRLAAIDFGPARPAGPPAPVLNPEAEQAFRQAIAEALAAHPRSRSPRSSRRIIRDSLSPAWTEVVPRTPPIPPQEGSSQSRLSSLHSEPK